MAEDTLGLVFEPVPPIPPRSPEVAEFFRDHPEFDIPGSLAFLVQQYPPDTSKWIVDSGVAVQALAGRRDFPPTDLDIVAQDQSMEDDFGHSNGLDPSDRRYIDVKSFDHWLLSRGEFGQDRSALWGYISALSVPMNIGGVVVPVMHPAIIVATKSTMAGRVQQAKDRADIALLDVSDMQLKAATDLLRGFDPEKQFKILAS